MTTRLLNRSLTNNIKAAAAATAAAAAPASPDRTMRVWDAASGALLRALTSRAGGRRRHGARVARVNRARASHTAQRHAPV